MIKIKEPIIVEGKYDKIKLSNLIDTLIIESNGFGIFSDTEKQEFLQSLCKKTKIIVMTDSDSSGFLIRNFLRSFLKDENIINVYVPDIFGKEKRKDKKSSEGKLGVEGISDEIILNALCTAGVFGKKCEKCTREITSFDLFSLGLCGGKNSKKKREKLLKSLSLPARLNTNSLLKYLNNFVSYEEFIEKTKEL